ncbi:MAG: hypothetical protein OEZ02_07910 [Anaerolineae bacterium]|nr:hypothetical protein [Anaerolineae bacterium]
MKRKYLLLSLLLLVVLVFAAGCGDKTSEVTDTPGEPAGEVLPPPEEPCEELSCMVMGDTPYENLWLGSAHADADAEAFRHWDEDDPAVVSSRCAKCHSTYGYQDFLGVDGSEVGVVDNDAPLGSTITCVACHNDATANLDTVTMPSGMEISGLGREARCMLCHQGRASKNSVDEAITEAGLTDLDTPSEDLGFTNIHYFAAAATILGKEAAGGYEYDGKSYDANLTHVDGYDTCLGCHDSHTLEVKVEQCADCHEGVTDTEDLKTVRMAGSMVDYDGDGDMEEGVYYEIEGMREKLYTAMQAYATDVVGTSIAYNSHAYPYFFVDLNADGEAGEDEAIRDNGYNAWTARLAKAAYNYQLSLKDPGAFAHGGKYVLQLLYDSIDDLNAALAEPVSLTNAHRIDHGHFAGSEEAFRHWDEEGEVSASCSRCHSATGLPLYLEQGVTINQPVSNGFSCSTCHDDLDEYTRYEAAKVTFPSGAVIDSGDPNTNLCMSCHQGRESTVSVDKAIGSKPADKVDESLRFRNVHYFAAGATLFGDEAKGAYQYAGKSYVGRSQHGSDTKDVNNCTQCHSTHELEVKVDVCEACHDDVTTRDDFFDIRVSEVDYDGDGDITEGMYGEVLTMRELLYAAIQSYASKRIGVAIVYDSHAYPYWFIDTNGNGISDEGEATRANGYASWTPRLLRAAYNYQYAAKDPGSFAHNPMYMLQILFDSLKDIGGSTSGMTRP